MAKLYAYWITVNYRDGYEGHASNGILFNHEGPVWDETFVTHKITRAVAAIEAGFQDRLYLEKFDARRAWGYAKGIWLIVQQDPAGNFALATCRSTYGSRDDGGTFCSDVGCLDDSYQNRQQVCLLR